MQVRQLMEDRRRLMGDRRDLMAHVRQIRSKREKPRRMCARAPKLVKVRQISVKVRPMTQFSHPFRN